MTALYVKFNISSGKATSSYTREATPLGAKWTLTSRPWRCQPNKSVDATGAICTPLTAGNVLNILRIRNGNIFFISFQTKGTWMFLLMFFFFLHLLCERVCQLCSFTFLSTETAKKIGCQIFPSGRPQAKVVLLRTYLLKSVQYQRIFLNSVQI